MKISSEIDQPLTLGFYMAKKLAASNLAFQALRDSYELKKKINFAWNLKKMAKSVLLKHYVNGNRKNIYNMPQGLPNPAFMQEKVQKGDF